MGNLTALIFVVMVLVLGIGACWAITANGASTTPPTDTFGNRASNQTIDQNNASAHLSVQTMPIVFIAFFIMICVVLVAGVAWLWKSGKSKASKY
jgi:hypothetical protein